MKTVAIFGVGLIGGSFALALRKAGFQGSILGVSSPETIQRALQLGVIDKGATLEEAGGSADLIYLAQPICRIISLLPELNHCVKPNALITDAGSTKSTIVEQARDVVHRCQFLGGHPMAGKESRGVEAADANLFRGRRYILTPQSQVEMQAPRVQEFLAWLERLGAETVILTPQEHDRAVAYTSHLPQLSSTGLAALLHGHASALKVSGPALLDMTRLALSPFETWGDIFATNKPAILEALRGYIHLLQEFAETLDSPEIAESFHRGALVARRLRDDRSGKSL